MTNLGPGNRRPSIRKHTQPTCFSAGTTLHFSFIPDNLSISMRRISVVSILIVSFMTTIQAQSSYQSKLIELGEAYKNYMFRAEPSKAEIEVLLKDVPPELEKATDFMVQTLISKNTLLTPKYLALPESPTLTQVYIIRHISFNREPEADLHRLIDSLSQQVSSRNDLIDNYYAVLFSAVGNKKDHFDLSKVNFELNEYGLENETEKGIFFLQCLNSCGKEIWGLMNSSRPPNTQKANALLKKFPMFNGRKYYHYTSFHFPDFNRIIIPGQAPQGYKKYYIGQYYEVLLSHMVCLQMEKGKNAEKEDLLVNSILTERLFYKYTKHEDKLDQYILDLQAPK